MNHLDVPLPVLRPLGVVENLFAAYNDSGAMVFSLAFELEGTLDAQAWHAAVARLPSIHPLLGTFIRHDAGGRRSFARGADAIEFVIEHRARTAWTQALADTINTPFSGGQTALMRARLFVDDHRQLFVATFVHAAADGMSALRVMNDVLAMVGGQLPPCRASMPMEEAMVVAIPPFWHSDQFGPGVQDLQEAHVDTVELDEAETKRLMNGTSAHGSTLHSALVVAFGHVMSKRRNDVVRVMSPVNVRNLTDGNQTSAVQLAIAISGIDGKDDAFWARTNDVHGAVRTARTRDAVEGFISRLAGTMAADESNAHTSRRIRGASVYDAIVTNLGAVPPVEVGQAPRVVASWGPIIRPLPGIPVVGVSLFESRLRLVSTSSDTRPLLGPLLEFLNQHL